MELAAQWGETELVSLPSSQVEPARIAFQYHRVMTEVAQLITTIKRELKSQGLTYRDVALALRLSEASIKRLFASSRFTVGRLVELSKLLGYTLAELAQESQAAAPKLHSLSDEQESKLVSDPKLLLTAVCLLNHWRFADIVSHYRLSEAECLKRALLLHRMGLVELLPGNRVRLKVSRDFDWRPDGAIRNFFRRQGQHEFLAAGFDGEMEAHSFSQGMLTGPAQAQLLAELRRLRTRFAALHDEGIAAPMTQRHGVGLLLALREWEPAVFFELRREAASGLPAGRRPKP